MGELLADGKSRDPSLEAAIAHVMGVAGELMELDSSIHSVGVGRDRHGEYEYIALSAPSALLVTHPSTAAPWRSTSWRMAGLSVRIEHHEDGPQLLATTAAGVLPGTPEQSLQRPLKCGLRIQNVDHDVRTGIVAAGRMTVGSIGCFVVLDGGGIGLLSNNHVIAGENNAQLGDLVLQPSAQGVSSGLWRVAKLTDFINLLTSPIGASVKNGTVVFNDIDAAVAELDSSVGWSNGYLPLRSVGPLAGTDSAAIGDDVYLVGSQSGYRTGTVQSVGTIVGPISYGIGYCWFRRSIAIVGAGGQPFAASGDSGAAVVRASDDRVLGMVYAASSTTAWACPIDEVFSALGCSLP